jgi:hypothetical protein
MPTDVMTSPPTAAALRADPFTALRYHFGMLLGVEDYETEQAYHRGQSRLASAWQHGAGVVWGYGVSFDPANGELRVEPGLAYDGAGQALRLDAPVCLRVADWVAEHHHDLGVGDPPPADLTFDAHVRIRFRACLARQVPAITSPCDGTASGTAYSRVIETVDVRLEAGPVPRRPAVSTYHRARVLFGIEEPVSDDEGDVVAEDQAVLDARAAVLALPLDDQPARWLAELRRAVARDCIDHRPTTVADQQLRYPAADGAGVVLAELRAVQVRRDGDGWAVSEAPVDIHVRPVLVDTTTITDLLCGPPASGTGAPPPDAGQPDGAQPGEVQPEDGVPAGDPPAGGTGPRVDRASVEVRTRSIVLRTDRPLAPASVAADAFSVTTFDDDGWNHIEVRQARYDEATNRVTLDLREQPGDRLVRLIAIGTGPTPLLGADRIPLAGAADSPAGDVHVGVDFVHQVDRSN